MGTRSGVVLLPFVWVLPGLALVTFRETVQGVSANFAPHFARSPPP
jgi:hypothetical protein